MFAPGVRLERAELSTGTMAYALRPGADNFLLFLHGLGCSKESFAEAFNGDYFGPEITLLAPDLLGHGDSSRPADFSYDLTAHAGLIEELLKKLDVARVAIVAHSMSNVCGLALTEGPFEVLGYFCLEGNLVVEDCNLSSRIARLDEALFVERLFPAAPTQFLCRGLSAESLADPTAFYRSSVSLVDHCTNGNLLERFIGLQAPAAYLYGDENRALHVLRHLPRTRTTAVPQAGHFLMFDNADFTYGEIAKRLRKH